MVTADQVLSKLLASGRASTLEEMDEALRASGLPAMTQQSVELLLDRIPSCTPILGDRWVNAETVIQERVFTHLLSEQEQASDILLVEPDLVAGDGMAIAGILALGDDPVVTLDSNLDAGVLAEAGLLSEDVDCAWLLPDGALGAFRPSVALAVRILAGGAIEISPVTAFDDQAGVAAVETLRSVLREHEAEVPVPADSLLLAACVADPKAFRAPVAPVVELFARAGIVRRGAFVAFDGFDFHQWEYEGEVRRTTRFYGVDEVGARAAVELARAVDGISSAVADLVSRVSEQGADLLDLPRVLERAGPPVLPPVSEPVTFALRHLSDPDVASAVLAMTLGSEEFTALPLTLAVAQWRPSAPRASRCALGWLEGKALERLGEHELAERSYDAAETIDPTWAPVLFELARFASDRGDAARALALLDRAGIDEDDDERVILAGFAAASEVLDRNTPCWCGSGRRVKACHRSPPPLPLEARAAWLHHKAVVFLQEGPWRGELLALGRERSRYWSGPEGLMSGLSDALVHDVMLCEGAVFDDFLEERGYLLPGDERELAENWIGRERSIFDVEDVVVGKGMTLRDMRSGDRVEVSERLATQTLRKGMIIVTRVLPCGEQWQVFGGIEGIPPPEARRHDRAVGRRA
jgi:tetratricopeptide (TPR) repeat protein